MHHNKQSAPGVVSSPTTLRCEARSNTDIPPIHTCCEMCGAMRAKALCSCPSLTSNLPDPLIHPIYTHVQEEQCRVDERHRALQPLHRLQQDAVPPPPNPLSRHTHLQEEQRRANEGHSALQPLHRLQEVARAGDTAAHIVGGYRVGVQIPLQRRGRGVDDWMGGKG